ncbi:MAG: aspartate-semialdehyde dehydrogenase [Bdellovibrionales bacterium RBG_16_40_8]|nr:MAG: aspartate-semialdehyde dehydrogenase [Bdellovibrionales bacterium RBG_16_40_8]
MNVGVVGATGMVGEIFMEILGKRKFPVKNLRPFASEKSDGIKVSSCGQTWAVELLKPGCFSGLDLVFFSSGDDISREWAPQALSAGAFVVDNSAAFRDHQTFPLVVPEVNGQVLPEKTKPTIIANPNCSTIQLVVVLAALRKFGLKEVRVASFQSVSGAGKAGCDELLTQTKEYIIEGHVKTPAKAFAHEIAFNCIPQIGGFNDNGFCSEEMKIMNETKKILSLSELKVSAFTVRVPSLNAHSEAVWVTVDKAVDKEDISAALENGEGLKFISHSNPEDYPTARMASGTNPVYVGRVHQDLNDSHTWLMWIVADNLLKGAALNGIQIAERIFDITPKA